MINWGSFGLVAAVAIGFSFGLVLIFSLGVRLLENAQNLVARTTKGNREAIRNEALNRMGAYVLFAVTFLALLYGIYLVVPAFHR